ncbi:S-layer homology domain-containing protein [Paenibacillus cymbidii]|uniref:S-layer homology domain-containing protein n=1 Tax=Paenibacillus cymbidii TaxID=1639034 RepID=UPI001081CFD9|nr:S-layer homology domain-containing protein [Paenibacillus cymbidii]
MKYRALLKPRKRLLCVLVFVLLFAAVVQPVRPVYALTPEGFDGGTGIPGDPFLISTPAQLDAVRNYLTKSFKLTGDISLGDYESGAGWAPIGVLAANQMFTGTLDGDGHAITHLTINRPAADYVGLFGAVNGGSIKNVRIVNPAVVGRNYVGPLAGRIWGIYEGRQSAVSNSGSSGGSVAGAGWIGGLVGDSLRNSIDYSYSSTNVTATNSVAGGLAAVFGQGTISNSYALGNVKTGGTATGGLVGFNSAVVNSGAIATISGSYAAGNVEGNISVGGLVGINENSASSAAMAVISNSYAVGQVKGTSRVGGLVGYNHSATIGNSYALGVVEGQTDVGGLVGASVTDQIVSSYYDKETAGIIAASPYAKSTEQMKTAGTFADWFTAGAWAMNSGVHGGYPYLPAGVSPATAALGQGAETTAVTAAVSPGNHLVVQVVSGLQAAPGLGDAVPVPGAIDPYVPGSDIGGVDAVTNKYVNVYEANPDGKIAAFKQLTLTAGDILTYAVDELRDQTLDALTVGYGSGAQESRAITLTRSGTADLTQLSVAVSGNEFAVTQPAATTLDAGTPTTSFTVAPLDGLGVGTHTATVTVSAAHMTDRTFTVTQIVNVPGAALLQVSEVGSEQVALEWSAIDHATGYRVFKRTASGVYDQEEVTVTGSTYRHTVTGLTNGTSYLFIVRAVVGGVEGADSNEVGATPKTVPGAPTKITATAGDGLASVAFSAPASNGGDAITRYTATSSPGGRSVSGTTSPIVVTGLTNGTTYTFTVTATNSKGEGPASTASNAVMQPIGVPALLAPDAGDTQVTLNWQAVGEATGYRIYQSSAAGTAGTEVDTVSAATLSYTVTGLTNSRSYYFTVKALIGQVESAASNERGATPVRWAGPGAPDGTFAGGIGIEENPYLIANATQMNAVRNYLNGSYKLVADIDLGGYAGGSGWVPIGSADPAHAFSGSFDGGTYRITGLTIDRPAEDNVGLFGYVSGQLVNVTLDAATIVGHDVVGGLAGFAKYGTIRNSRSSGTITGNNDVGGLVGHVFPGTVGNSFSTADVTGFYRVGGLVGTVSDVSTVSDSGSAGNVTGIASSFYIGGLVGQIDGAAAKIRNSRATGAVQGANEVGGLVGSNRGAAITTSYSSGNVTSDWTVGGLVGSINTGTIADSYTRSSVTVNTARSGAFAGYNAGTSVVRNYAAGEANGAAPIGGYSGMYVGAMPSSNYYDHDRIPYDDVFARPVATAAMKTSGTYANWDFDETWGIDPAINDGYPYLRYLAPVLSATASPGETDLTTKVTASPDFGNHLVVQVSTVPLASAPAIGDAVPAAGVTNPYVPESPIGGVDAATNKYVVVYEADNRDKIMKVAQLALTSAEIRPSYRLEQPGNRTLDPLTEGYAAGTQQEITIPLVRSGTGDLAHLTVSASGNAFEVTAPAVTTLTGGTPTTSFTVKAKNGLAAGTYTATVTVTADHMTPVAFTVTQAVAARYVPTDPTGPSNTPTAPPGTPAAPTGSPGTPTAPNTYASADPGNETTGATLLVKADVHLSAGGTTVATIDVDGEELVVLLQALTGKRADAQTATVAVDGEADDFIVHLPIAAIRHAAVADAPGTLIVKTASATYAMPLRLLRELAAADSSAETITIAISRIDGTLQEKIERAAKSSGLSLLNKPIAFEVAVGEQERADFGGTYVKRTVFIAGGADPSESTAVWYDPVADAFHFVPSTFHTVDGVTEVAMQSPHNSVYTVIRTAKTFADLQGHWAMETIELLASKLIVNGVSAEAFAPEASVTRAEFAALLVRSLGLGEAAAASSVPFRDVEADAWYAGVVQAAVQSGLVTGFGDGTFRPEERITREQMTVMLAATLKFAGKVPAADDSATQTQLQPLDRFVDRTAIHDWAIDSAALAVRAGIVDGLPDATFAPTAFATRAEAGTMLVRMLRYAAFLN